MADHQTICHSVLAKSRADAAQLVFQPKGTVRCVGTPLFRNQAVRDFSCLLDLDPEVEAWSCLPLLLRDGFSTHVPDLLVRRADKQFLMDVVAGTKPPNPSWIAAAAADVDCVYVTVRADDFSGSFRLQNAKDLLRYARWRCPLGDRVRLLAALDEHGSLTVAECPPAFLETPPIAGLSSLILNRFVEVDLDDALIGPETLVRRWRD